MRKINYAILSIFICLLIVGQASAMDPNIMNKLNEHFEQHLDEMNAPNMKMLGVKSIHYVKFSISGSMIVNMTKAIMDYPDVTTTQQRIDAFLLGMFEDGGAEMFYNLGVRKVIILIEGKYHSSYDIPKSSK